ncbi:STAS domain-containing protein, partial [Rhodobaculum claviforme]|uniref:STAS domain-containing protein n=1 Tax=Rhodobaculum claviforme TaxID=1549854 RepID=UPI003083FA36
MVEVTAVLRALDRLPADRDMVVDLAGAGHMDTAGAWAVLHTRARLTAAGHTLDVTGANDKQRALLDTVAAAM